MNYTTITINDLVDYVEANIMKSEFLEELKNIIKLWGESEMIKSNISETQEVEEKAKKKSSRGRK